MYKKICLCFIMTCMFMLFGSTVTTHAETHKYVIDGGVCDFENGIKGQDVLTIITCNSNIKLFLQNTKNIPLGEIEEGTTEKFDVYYCILNDDGSLTYGGNLKNCSEIMCTLNRYQNGELDRAYNDSYLYATSGFTPCIPYLPYSGNGYGVTDDGMTILQEYFLYGKGAYYDPGPLYDEESVVSDPSIGYLTNLRVYFKNDSGTDSVLADADSCSYVSTWEYNHYEHVTGEAVQGPPTVDGATGDGYITKLEMKIHVKYKLASKLGTFFDTEKLSVKNFDDLGTFNVFGSFGDMPSIFNGAYSLSVPDLCKLASNYINQSDLGIDLDECSYYADKFYFRILRYDKNDKKFYSGTWYEAALSDDGKTFSLRTGSLDDDGNFTPDGSGPSYSLTKDGTYSGGDMPDDWKDDKDKLAGYENGDIGDWSWDNIDNVLDFFIDLPQLLAMFFSFIPSVVWWAFAGVLLVVVAMRILGR